MMFFQSLVAIFLSLASVDGLPAPPKEPTFSVGGTPKSTSPYFNGQHIYGNAPNVPNKPKNTIITPNQHVQLQPTPSGNLQSTHPVAVQEFKKGVPQAPRQGYIKVSEGKYGDINHYAATYPCKRSPGACKLPTGGGGAYGAASTFGRYAGKVGRVLGGPEAAVLTTAVDNAVLGYQTSAKYNELLKNGGRDFQEKHRWKAPSLGKVLHLLPLNRISYSLSGI